MNAPPDPRVLHVILDLDRGGAQEALCVLAEARPASSARAFFVCALSDGPLRRRLEAVGAHVEILPGPACRFWRVIRYRRELLRIRAGIRGLVNRHQIDVVQTHVLNVLDFLAVRLEAGRRRPAVVWTFHGPDFLPARPGPTLPARRAACRWLYRFHVRHVSAIVCVSEAVRRAVAAAIAPDARVLRVIPNAPSPSRIEASRPRGVVRAEAGVADTARIVLFVGRLSTEKGCDRLIEAAPAVLASVPDTTFLVAGCGPEEAALRDRAVRAGVAGRVRFLGARDDVGDLLAAADLFCLPSRREGMSMALIEAMSAGLAVVATDLAANREVVEHGRTGLLVDAGEPSALAGAIARLLSCPGEAWAMGEAARRDAVARFSAAAQQRACQHLYREVCARRTVA